MRRPRTRTLVLLTGLGDMLFVPVPFKHQLADSIPGDFVSRLRSTLPRRPLRPPLLEQPRQVRDGDYLRPLREDLVHERVLDLRDGVGAGVADHDEAIVAICCVADC